MDEERENYVERGTPTHWRLVRRIVAVVLFIALVAIVVEWALLPHRYTQEEADQIQPGMTATEVEELLGRPPDETAGGGRFAMWKSRASAIDVVYQDGRVERVVFKSGPAPSFCQRWKLHLGLPH